jgi:quinol monooxygenase YgiN
MAEQMILTFPVIPEKRDEFIQMLIGALPDTRAYDGCNRADLYTSEGDDSSVNVFEDWDSRAQQQSYFDWRVQTGLLDAIGPMLQGQPTVTWLNSYGA